MEIPLQKADTFKVFQHAVKLVFFITQFLYHYKVADLQCRRWWVFVQRDSCWHTLMAHPLYCRNCIPHKKTAAPFLMLLNKDYVSFQLSMAVSAHIKIFRFWHHIVLQVEIYVSEVHTASIFRAELTMMRMLSIYIGVRKVLSSMWGESYYSLVEATMLCGVTTQKITIWKQRPKSRRKRPNSGTWKYTAWILKSAVHPLPLKSQ